MVVLVDEVPRKRMVGSSLLNIVVLGSLLISSMVAYTLLLKCFYNTK